MSIACSSTVSHHESPDSTTRDLESPDHGWSRGHTEDREPFSSGSRDTILDPFEHFEAGIRKLGAFKDRYTDRAGSVFRRSLADSIARSDDPFRRIRAIVEHVCMRPSQDKVADGAEVLSAVGARLIEFIEGKDEEYFPDRSPDGDANDTIVPCDRVWLYAAALSELEDEDLRRRAARILCRWLKNKDSDIRESAAGALGTLALAETREALNNALQNEHDSAVRDAIEDALDEINSA